MLTETNDLIIDLENYNSISTEQLPKEFDGIKYKEGEKRVSIYSKYEITKTLSTYDGYTSVCAVIDFPLGELNVYGTIIGVFGNRQPRFNEDLQGQISDFEKYFRQGNNALIGDLNTTFSGRPWPSRHARLELNSIFQKFNLKNTTQNIENNVDHIVLSESILANQIQNITTWNEDKKLSDHLGIMLDLAPNA